MGGIISNVVLNEVLLLGMGFGYVGVIIATSMTLKKKDVISGHFARKLVHLMAGFACFIVPFLNFPWLALIISASFLAITRISKPSTPIFEMMGEKDERDVGYLAGPFSYALSINILVLVFSFMPQWFFFPASSIMVMMISDTAASFFGKRYGKHKITIPYTNTTRSLEGSLALFVTALFLSLFAFSFFGSWFPENHHTMSLPWILILSLLLAGISTIIEIVSPSNLDDLIVPIVGCFMSFLLTILMFPESIGFAL